MNFLVTESTLSATQLGEFIIARYQMNATFSCRLLRTGMNHLYVLGNGSSKFVLRVYTLNWRTKREIEEELKLLILLKEHGLSVSYPIKDSSDNFIQEVEAPEGLRYAVLFSYADGKKVPAFTSAASFNLGLTMAKMHQLTHSCRLERINYDVDTLLTKPLNSISSFFATPRHELEFLEKLVVFLKNEFKNAEEMELRKGVVHLDIWFDNIHFKSETDITLFDFDFCGNGWLCLDISFFLYQLFNTNPDVEHYKEKADNFLKGYESIMPLPAEEKNFFRIACLGIMVFYLGIQCIKFDTWSNIFLNEEHFKRYVGSLKRWIKFNGIESEFIN